ncbi:MAG: RNA-binding protein [Candidatus Aenigmatarchaeota archaeon]|nr:MAG: RNA-binding protein [Candidatus Aenigmarchaeota archaeon]
MMIIQKNHIRGLASAGKRMDGRKEDDFREIKIETGVIENAEGSAKVSVGKTEIIAGVKMNIGEPFPDRPDEGILMTGAEFSPLASFEFETGPPSEDAIELARVVDRGIRESHMIDNKKLCIAEGEKVWMVFVDIHILNHDGNLLDCAALAAAAALGHAKFPKYDGEKIEFGEKTDKGLPITCKPIAVTLTKVGEKLLTDATFEEEGASDVKLTVTTKDDGNICAIQKSGSGPLAFSEIEKAFEISVRKGKELRKLLE